MGDIEVNIGEGVARGLFNLSRREDITFWFNGEELNRLLSLPESEFEEEFELMVKQAKID